MWVAKIKIEGANTLLGNLAKMFSISATGYPVHTYEKEDSLYTDFAGFIFGTEENEKNFLEKLNQSSRITNLEKEGNFIIARIKESMKNRDVYQYDFIHVEPVVIKEDGTEFWTLGTKEKEKIMKFISALEKIPGAEILSVQQKKISNLALVNIQPNFSLKQRIAMDLAVRHGYYTYPRRITIKQLAKIEKLSYSTFQAHLRKAENKFFPFCFYRFYH